MCVLNDYSSRAKVHEHLVDFKLEVIKLYIFLQLDKT